MSHSFRVNHFNIYDSGTIMLLWIKNTKKGFCICFRFLILNTGFYISSICYYQTCIIDFVRELSWSFFALIINDLKSLTTWSLCQRRDWLVSYSISTNLVCGKDTWMTGLEHNIHGSTYSRMDQVKSVEDSLWKFYLVNTLSHINQTQTEKISWKLRYSLSMSSYISSPWKIPYHHSTN